MSSSRAAPGHYLLASDFDHDAELNDSGLVLSELIGVPSSRIPSPRSRVSVRMPRAF